MVNPPNPATQTNPPVHFDDPVSEKLGRQETMRPADDLDEDGWLNGRSLAQILNSNIPRPNPQNTVQNDCALCHTSATPDWSYPALLNSPEYSVWNAGQMGGCTGCHLAKRLGHVPTNEEYWAFKGEAAEIYSIPMQIGFDPVIQMIEGGRTMDDAYGQADFIGENRAYNAWYSANCTLGCHNPDAVESVYGSDIWQLRGSPRPITRTRDLWEAGFSQLSGGAIELVGEVSAGLILGSLARGGNYADEVYGSLQNTPTGEYLLNQIDEIGPRPPIVFSDELLEGGRIGSYYPRENIIRLHPEMQGLPEESVQAVVGHELTHRIGRELTTSRANEVLAHSVEGQLWRELGGPEVVQNLNLSELSDFQRSVLNSQETISQIQNADEMLDFVRPRYPDLPAYSVTHVESIQNDILRWKQNREWLAQQGHPNAFADPIRELQEKLAFWESFME